MSSARNHWILDKATSYARGWWPVQWGTGPDWAKSTGPREGVRCSQRHRGIPPAPLHQPLATHAAGFEYITGKRGRLSRRHFYLCDRCAETFRARHGDHAPPAEERGGWTGAFSQPSSVTPPAPAPAILDRCETCGGPRFRCECCTTAGFDLPPSPERTE